MIRCCYKCQKRRPGTPTTPDCHADCPTYIAEKAKHLEELEAKKRNEKSSQLLAEGAVAAEKRARIIKKR